jgi:hypothetical protein
MEMKLKYEKESSRQTINRLVAESMEIAEVQGLWKLMNY